MIIGSTAIKHYFPDFPREPKDLDFVVPTKKGLGKPVGNTEFLENPIILKYQKEGYLKPDLMLSLKVSHLFWDINWDKHLYDTIFLLKKGVKWDISLIQELREYWEEFLPKIRRSKLSQNKEDFFTNSINKDSNEHDYLHTLLNPVPMYTRLLKDGCDVELDENKWHNLTFEEKCDVVFEESAIMSWERYKNTHYIPAYRRQLKDNIMKHFPFFIAIFAIEHYPLLEKPKYNYKLKIENGLRIN